MTNHAHLLLAPIRPDGVALLMKHLGQRYVRDINRTCRRSGALWDGRFRSCLTRSVPNAVKRRTPLPSPAP